MSGEEALLAMETMPTKREGIFVMPRERISIVSTYVKEPYEGTVTECISQLKEAKLRNDGLVTELNNIRQKRLPG